VETRMQRLEDDNKKLREEIARLREEIPHPE